MTRPANEPNCIEDRLINTAELNQTDRDPITNTIDALTTRARLRIILN